MGLVASVLRILSSVGSLLTSIGIMTLGGSLLGILLPLNMHAAGLSTETAGLVMAAYFGGMLAGSVYGRRIIGRVGHIRAYAGFGAIVAALILGHGLWLNGAAWAALRFVHGFCGAGLSATLESWLHERSDNRSRGRVLGIYLIIAYAAVIGGQLSVNLWHIESLQGYAVAALLTCLALVPVLLTRIAAPDLSGIEPLGFYALYKASPLAVVGCVASGMMMGTYFGLGALFASDIGLNVLGVSLFTGSVMFGALALQWPIGRLSDRVERRRVLLGVLATVVAVCAVAAVAGHDGLGILGLMALGALLGGTASSVYPLATAQAFDHLPRARYVAASGGLLLAYAIGAAIGPASCGRVMAMFGPYAFFGFIGSVAAALALFVAYRMTRRAAVPVAEQEAVVVVPRNSPLAAELDPRTPAASESHRTQ